jgi:hypothetical protein
VVQTSLRFTLSCLDGCGVLELDDRTLDPGGRAERVILEIPGLRFPFDLSGGLLRFQNRRCRLRELVLSFTSVELGRLISPVNLADFGLFDPRLEIHREELRFVARAMLGGRQAHFTARARLGLIEPSRLRLTVHDIRVYGFLPVPAPMLGVAIFSALGARRPGEGAGSGKHASWASSLLEMVGSSALEISALELSLFALLAAHGWRLPERRAARLEALELGVDRLKLRWSNQGPRPDPAELVEAPERRFPEAESALAAGDLPFALSAYRQAHAQTPDDRFVRGRLLQLLAASPDRLPELAAVLSLEKADCPDAPMSLLTEALLASQRGQSAEAAGYYHRLAVLAEMAGETLDETCARLAAAQEYERAGDLEGARTELEHLTRDPGSGSAS